MDMLTHETPDSSVSYNTAVKPTIFAVEDDTDISRLVRHHLEGAGYAVRTFLLRRRASLPRPRRRRLYCSSWTS